MPRRGIRTICLLIAGMLCTGTALHAQDMNQGNPPLYIYVSQWAVPRAQWADLAKLDASQRAIEDKLLADGTITGYGRFFNLIHTEDGPTHGNWIAATSQGNILKALEAFYAAPSLTAPVLAASKHWDYFLVSHMHNWRPGAHDNAYLSGSMWRVKPGQGMAFRNLMKSRVVPVFEKLIQDGTIVSYSIDMEAYNTSAPGLFEVVFVAPQASGLDKVHKAFQDAFSKDVEIDPALQTLIKGKSIRDFLFHVTHMESK
jgi:hypothetical protein